jgi:hypothetical protein
MGKISLEQVNALLKEQSEQPSRGRRADPTEPRTSTTWYKLSQRITGDCENPNCVDPRPPKDLGRNITSVVHDKQMCRYCFLDGWLSPNGKIG